MAGPTPTASEAPGSRTEPVVTAGRRGEIPTALGVGSSGPAPVLHPPT
jgi:hypothetical protein